MSDRLTLRPAGTNLQADDRQRQKTPQNDLAALVRIAGRKIWQDGGLAESPPFGRWRKGCRDRCPEGALHCSSAPRHLRVVRRRTGVGDPHLCRIVSLGTARGWSRYLTCQTVRKAWLGSTVPAEGTQFRQVATVSQTNPAAFRSS